MPVCFVVTLKRLPGKSMSYGGSRSQMARITSIASANSLLRSSSSRPSASASERSAPGLTPKMKRPRDRWSNIAACEAICAGCECERFEVPVASLICSVACTSEARKMKLLVMFSDFSVRCSPTKASWKPSRSARMMVSRSSCRVCDGGRWGGCSGIMKSPRRILASLSFRFLGRGHAEDSADHGRRERLRPGRRHRACQSRPQGDRRGAERAAGGRAEEGGAEARGGEDRHHQGQGHRQ